MSKGLCYKPRCNSVFPLSTGEHTDCRVCGSTSITEKAAKRYAELPGPVCAAPVVSDYAVGNPKAAQGAKKYSLRLLPLPAAIAVNRALEDGMKKYGAANWRETDVAASVYVDAAMRHLAQWYDGGQENAGDSGIHNLGHAMACFAIIIDAQANGKLINDRPAPCKDTDSILLRAKP